MNSKIALITGSCGLIGAQSVEFFIERGFTAVGIDNDMRAYFFGQEASIKNNREYLQSRFKDKYIHFNVDIRSKDDIERIFKEHNFDVIIHAAAQPSHDWAARQPFTDFEINANGTLNLLESCRKYSAQAVFIFTSTNKVYGDRPNQLPLIELETRWELSNSHPFFKGIDESMSVDDCLHSLFGASKVAADILVQEYGRYFGIKTAVFRGGCLTGPLHKAALLHGFLAYLAKCVATQTEYTIYGYKGKQVRDNIHSYDLVNAFWHFYEKPACGQVYNIGGGRHSNISMKEAISYFERALNKKANIKYCEQNRKGDHIWYISDMGKFHSQYPQWEYVYDIYKIMDEICAKGALV
ncbi:MAG: NAD-dependent epimerase/dehydratase family protein [Candidatus Omnitrophota bacterium]|nr:MAG: NAD-dependent epimerase/dehydratase family protein [Candidatus Omnitrophota bacterium]